MERKKITFDSFIRGVIVALVIIGILMLFKRLSSVLLPFFIAWLVAYLIYPLVTLFQYRLRVKNRVAAIFCALLSIVAVCVAAYTGVLLGDALPTVIDALAAADRAEKLAQVA